MVIHLHQPKTAGKTLEVLMKRYYREKGAFARISLLFPEAAITDISKYDALLEAMPGNKKSEFQMLTGHVFYGLHRHFDNFSGYISLVRDPADRIISFYHYFLEDPSSEFGKALIDNGITLEDFVGLEKKDVERLKWNELHYTLENGQTKLMAGIHLPVGQSTPDLLTLARNNIEKHFVFVGLTERFDESLVSIHHLLEWQTPLYYLRVNTTRRRKKKKDVSRDVLQTISERNTFDFSLHKEIKANFDQSLPISKIEMKRRLRRMQFLNEWYAKYVAFRVFISSKIHPSR